MTRKYNFNSFSVVVPIYNEEKIFLESAQKIYDICKSTNLNFEIIFSENGSDDRTIDIANKFCKENLECKVINLPFPDYGNALKNSFKIAKYDLVVSFDIDYYSEDFLHQALNLDEEYVALIASKRLKDSGDNRSIFRRLISSIFVNILKVLFGTNLSDTHGMKALKNEILQSYISKVISNQWMFDTELLMRLEKSNYKIKEIPIEVVEIRPSVYSLSSDIPKTLYLILKLRFRLFFDSK